MEFNYFTDDFQINEELLKSKNEHIDFKKIISSILKCYHILKIDAQTKVIFYSRNKKGKSILGIQVLKGKINDLSNYIFFDASPNSYNGKIAFDIDMHADAKCSSVLMNIASMLSDEILMFFNSAENTFVENPDIEIQILKELIPANKKKGKVKNIFKWFK